MPDSDWLQGALRKAIAAFLGFMLGFVLLVALLLTGFYLLVNAATLALTPWLGVAGALAVTGLSCLLLLFLFFYRMTRPLPSKPSDGSSSGQSSRSPVEAMKRLIQKNPLEAALAAFALGVLEQGDPRMKSLLMQGGMALAKEAERQQGDGGAENEPTEAANDAADS
ncbi:hypothetical protein [Marinobacter sp. MDS2]|uniref:hypothetical protein n=1 Tax=Marinobacter sp. MDS2 TaxID=3065961 RepID=UPI00273B6916|nr:hypothetical protein [Marinobacter sp. MDS2]MDP4547119.1 hypothetical protein [Marinobacter sp. MDS2]